MRSLFTVFLCFLLLGACSNKGNHGVHKNVTGRAGELLIVISDKSWDDIPGNILRKTLAQPQYSLPQDEPLFDLIAIPHEGFKDIFRTTRNIIQTRISPIIENQGVTYTDNIWAYPQATVQINARNNEEFEKIFNENSDKIISYFLKAERDRMISVYKGTNDKAVYNTLKDKYDIMLQVPPGFKVSQEKENFVWLRYETPEISQAIMVYWFPYKSDSTFTTNYLLNMRDSILKANVPGPLEGSYMATERRVEPTFNIFRHNGNYAAELRGLWRVEKDFMGGPFLMLSELDIYRQRVVVADGYVYAPSKNKRNYLRQVEAMIYSMSFTDQDKNDKLNSQFDLGN